MALAPVVENDGRSGDQQIAAPAVVSRVWRSDSAKARNLARSRNEYPASLVSEHSDHFDLCQRCRSQIEKTASKSWRTPWTLSTWGDDSAFPSRWKVYGRS